MSHKVSEGLRVWSRKCNLKLNYSNIFILDSFDDHFLRSSADWMVRQEALWTQRNKNKIHLWFVSVRVDSFDVEEDRLHFTTWERKEKHSQREYGDGWGRVTQKRRTFSRETDRRRRGWVSGLCGEDTSGTAVHLTQRRGRQRRSQFVYSQVNMYAFWKKTKCECTSIQTCFYFKNTKFNF